MGAWPSYALFFAVFPINTVYPLLPAAARTCGPRWVLFFDALFRREEGNGQAMGEITRRYARKCTRPQRSAAARERKLEPSSRFGGGEHLHPPGVVAEF